jgi:hypothetical protein
MRLLLVVLFLGCIPPAPQPQARYTGQQPQQAQQPPSLTCMELFSCIQSCNGDNACFQTCLGRTDADTQTAASALMQCGASRCQEAGSECLATECQAEMETCRISEQVAAAPQGQPAAEQPVQEQMIPGQPHTTANLLPWMTGAWIGTNHQFEFYGDGRVRRSSGTPMYTDKGKYGCVSLINETGTVTQEGDMLIMKFEPAQENHCGNKSEKTAALTVRYKITWYQYSDSPVALLLVDIDCTKGAMWCNDQMRRR